MSDPMQEIEELLSEWDAGTLSDEGVRRLRELLRGDENARIHFARLQTFHAALRSEAGRGESLVVPASGDLGSTRNEGGDVSNRGFGASVDLHAAARDNRALSGSTDRSSRTLAFFIGAIAAGLMVFVFFRRPVEDEVAGGNGSRHPTMATGSAQRSDAEPSSPGVAMVTQVAGVDAMVDGRELSAGQALVPGNFEIDEGVVQIEFFCGATVVLEGPAKLELVTTDLARLERGKLRAQVPPAALGFTVEANDTRVVDLGTEFGVVVSDDGMGVEVFEGEVEVHHPGDVARLLEEGEAVTHGRDGVTAHSDARPEEFVDVQSFHEKVSARQLDRYHRWQAWSESFRHDPRLIAYYDFNNFGRWNRRLRCRIEPVDQELDGAIVGAVPAEGRWAGKTSLEFKHPGDRVRVSIPGEYRSLSFSAWVRIDSLDRWYNSLFLTDDYNEGEPHWQILDTGQLYFSVRAFPKGKKKPVNKRKVLSPVFWDPSLSGKWLHLATTYDVDRCVVRHYLDGELLHEQAIPKEQVATNTRFGPSTIGNWTRPYRPDRDFAIRNLNGSIDEFAIFSDVLSAAEIQEIYLHGKP
ncbi:LamG domain-containing protein [Rhodopirellula sallentina]|uniref:FecR protein domain protein n=1 Tax=Rhodopirellula sallentina SM41 TaxID=1263870 RepID=M5UP65_9BACT|nr:LamG domain-containing protein [Rhodopirellula sallentina]EMI57793.1 FecR protein domain protein [Rhodopirellula sallentina SM41]